MLIHSSVLSLALPFKKEFYVHDYWLSFIGILTDSIYITEIPVTFHRNHSVNVTGKPPLKKKIKRLFDKKKPARFYYLDTVLKTPEILNTVNAESLKELKKAKRYFKYKNFFLYRLFRPVFLSIDFHITN